MNQHNEITLELKALQAAQLEKAGGVCFDIPDLYFEQLSGQILQQIHGETISSKFPKEIPFAVPENYFEQLPQLIRQKLLDSPADEEIEELSPLLAGLKDKATFELPTTDYFDRLQPEKPTKVIAMPVSEYHSEKKIKWMSWIAAAVVVCIFGLGGGSYLREASREQIFNNSVQEALANISDDAIQQYLSNNMDTYELYSALSEGTNENARNYPVDRPAQNRLLPHKNRQEKLKQISL